jgi:serine/threonine protein kinase
VNYCMNPWCQERANPDSTEIQTCQTCGTPLLVHDRYRLLRPLRELGGQAYTEIFEVVDTKEADIRKVMKILRSPELLEMFQREAQTLQSLALEQPALAAPALEQPALEQPDSPLGIPLVAPDGYFTVKVGKKVIELHCLVMEKIEGLDLEEWRKKQNTLSEELALKWLYQLTVTLARLHQKGLLHRDIKPSNIMRRSDEQLVLIDFGTVRETTDTYMAKIGRGRGITSIVSPGYTPLEQIDGRAVPQSDFYALGRSFVYLLTGKHPIEFADDNDDRLIWRQDAPQISTWLADLIDDLMSPLRRGRPQTADEILERLTTPGHPSSRQAATPQISTARSPLLNGLVWINVVLLLLQLVVGSVVIWRLNQPRSQPGARSQQLDAPFNERSMVLGAGASD